MSHFLVLYNIRHCSVIWDFHSILADFSSSEMMHLWVNLLCTVSGVMSNVGHKKSHSDWELTTMERRYSVPPGPTAGPHDTHHARGQPLIHPVGGPSASEDLHAWSIYRSYKFNSNRTKKTQTAQKMIRFFKLIIACEIWGLCSVDIEDSGLLGWYAVWWG